MANLSKTRTVFAVTSPRTIEKIIPEIAILVEEFAGRIWNKETQLAYFESLYRSDFYNARIPPQDKAFAARDRITRAPKALGFVNLKPTIQLTEAGSRLLSGKRTSEVFSKQLLKFQLPSHYHKIPVDRGFNVRPYLELLRMISELGSLSKTEIAIFFVQLTNYNNFDRIKEAIEKYRRDISATAINRDIFRERVFKEELKKIFASEIAAGDLETRESNDDSLENFLDTKKGNQMDYADAFMRYMRSTQLVTFEKRTFRLIINPDRIEEVDFILENIPRGATDFPSMSEFQEYLFNPDAIVLLSDSTQYLDERLKKIGVEPPIDLDIEDFKDFVEVAEGEKTKEVIHEAEVSLKDYNDFDDVMEVFQKIRDKAIPAPALFLEWNVWRGLVMINDARSIQGNFKLDLDGMPLSTAPANRPDIEAEYEDFSLIVEVTTSSGQTQFNMEGESVPRHFGNAQRNTENPVYCIFVAPAISNGALAHFFNLNKNHTDYYGGKTRIVPMTLAQYSQFLSIAKENRFQNSKILKVFLDKIIDHNQEVQGEIAWSEYVDNSIAGWAAA